MTETRTRWRDKPKLKYSTVNTKTGHLMTVNYREAKWTKTFKFSARTQGYSQSKYAQLYKHKHCYKVNWNLSSSLEYLSSWLATTEKKGNSVWQPAEWCRAPSQSGSHGNQASEQAFEMQNKRMTKCGPCPLFLLLSAPTASADTPTLHAERLRWRQRQM